MTIYYHLGKALEIIRKEPDFMKWGPLIDALKPEEQAECRQWLRMQARLAKRRREQASRESRPSSLASNSTRRSSTSRPRKASPT
jgi:hypothetical protein